MRLALALLAVLALAACREDQAAALPDPVRLTDAASAHFCQMTMTNMPGPKAQVHLAGFENPLWFAQIRDMIAFLRSPEKVADIRAIYVSDMGTAESWARPGSENWTGAESAFYVVGSGKRGGMGAPEVVPFEAEAAARAFAATQGGEVMRFDDIPDEAVLGPVDIAPPEESPS